MAQIRVAVVQPPDAADRWDGVCECGFVTARWPSRDSAEARIGQHLEEHTSGALMSPLDEFRRAWGIGVTADGEAYLLPEGAEVVGEAQVDTPPTAAAEPSAPDPDQPQQ